MDYLPEDLYKTITGAMPIACVDLIPVRKVEDVYQIGVITRATGPESGRQAVLGGRIYLSETIADSISRHLKANLGISTYSFLEGNEVARPFYVQQYFRSETAEPPYGYDPTKHAIALTYLIKFQETAKPVNEASAFYWIKSDDVPKSSAYNQHLVMMKTFKFLLARDQIAGS
ncbi:MAG TPA: DUF4916 domain-containing protein [Candidatus Sulfotelmatobacter sp.]|nr:DUF4916 domain-containing protein [Candidatus Sulfotelmatobacter sp.]